MQNIKVIDFENTLEEAYLIQREKRFFVKFAWKREDVVKNLPNLVAHTNNTGSMLGLLGQGRRILLSKANNPNRKLGWTLEAVSANFSVRSEVSVLANCVENTLNQKHISKANWIGVNTSIPNKFLHNLFQLQCAFPEKDILPWAKGYTHIRMEATNGDSRLDALIYSQAEHKLEADMQEKSAQANLVCDNLQDDIQEKKVEKASSSPKKETSKKKKCPQIDPTTHSLWVECKSVTLVEDDRAAFPDAISERGAKHLETLMRILEEGKETKPIQNQKLQTEKSLLKNKDSKNSLDNKGMHKKTRAAMLYIIQRTDGTCFYPADYIDKVYSEKLLQAYKAGVEVYAIIANVQKDGVYYGGTLPLAPCFFV